MVEAPRRRSWTRSLLLIAAVLGPGFITASAGNDVGGIAQYSAAGAQFGYTLLWLMIPLAVALIVVQEMATRMGCVTGKGLAALMRETFGVRISFLAMVLLFLINTLLTATEFAGVAAASEIFGVSKYIAVPGALVVVFLLVLRLESKIPSASSCFSRSST
jgi:Mn2+/Fe2+ NRAMP family transporter